MTQRTLSRTVPALLPTPGANDSTGAEKETRERRQADGATGGPSLRDLPRLLPTPTTQDGENTAGPSQRERNSDPLNLVAAKAAEGELEEPKLLPTPVVTDSFGSRRSTARTEEWTSNPGTTLTDAIWETQGREVDTRGRLLPTPQAADGDGGRQEKGAMGAAGRRPSGQKATLPLGTAVGMRETISETPFTEDPESGQVTLLPTPTAEDGERGRNGSGSDRLDAATFDDQLLPTPKAADGENASEQGPRHYIEGSDNPTLLGAARRSTGELRHSEDPADRLLPTPETANRKGRRAMTSSGADDGNGRRSGGGMSSPPGLEQIAELKEGRWPRDLPPYEDLPPATREIIDSLLPTPTPGDAREPSDDPAPGPAVLKDAAQGIAWGVYEAAIRRWERILGREAPVPTDENVDGADPAFRVAEHPLDERWS